MNKRFWTDLWWLLVYAFVALLLLVIVSVGVGLVTSGTLSLHLIQWSQTLLLMMVPPMLWVKWYKKERVCETLRLQKPKTWHCVWAAVLMTVLLPLLSIFEEYSRVICEYCLPDCINAWAADMLAQQEVTVQAMLAVNGLMGWTELILLMSVATAIGEELMFRGALVRCFEGTRTDRDDGKSGLLAMSGSQLFWTAFWVGLLFAAIHMDLYGLLPRWILGALFVYIVYWTGSLWPAVVAHATNNLWALIQMKLEPEWMERMDSATALIASIVVILAMVWAAKKRHK